MKKKRTFSVTKIRLVLIAYVAFHYQNMMCILSSQLSFAFGESLDSAQSFQDIDFTNLTHVDILARKAMEKLHDDLDRDDDGNVSLSEGAQYIKGQGEMKKPKNQNLPGFATDKDGRITETEFWENWEKSAIHNWTISQMSDWLNHEVGLPQYSDSFKQYGISGAAMPILANNGSIVLSLVNGAKDHKLKLWLKAMEVVLCGYSPSQSGWLKDILLTISLGLAIGGVIFALHVQRKATQSVSLMQGKLVNLQKELQTMEEEDMWVKDRDSYNFSKNTDTSSSNTSLESESSIQSKLQEALNELADTKSLLEEAEERLKLNYKKWTPDKKLLNCLKETYQVELKFHEAKRDQAQKKVEAAKSQFHKMKRRSGIFSSVQFIHSRQVDRFDLDVQTAKEALTEVQYDSREHRKRWADIEVLCGFKFCNRRKGSNNIAVPLVAKSEKLEKNGKTEKVEENVKLEKVDKTEKVQKVEKHEKVEKVANIDQSKSKVLEQSQSKPYVAESTIKHRSSCPTLSNLNDQRPRSVTEPVLARSSSATEPRQYLKLQRSNTPPVIFEENNITTTAVDSPNPPNNHTESNASLLNKTAVSEMSKSDSTNNNQERSVFIKRTPSSVSTKSQPTLLKDSIPNSQSLPDLTLPKLAKKSKSPGSVSHFKVKKGFGKSLFNSFRKQK